MALPVQRGLSKLRYLADQLVKTVSVRCRGSSDIIKGTTLRDLYEKGKVLFMDHPHHHQSSARGSVLKLQSATARGNGAEEAGGAGLADPDAQEDNLYAAAPDASAEPRRRIVVAHRLPLRAEPNPDAPHGFDFSVNADALPHQLSEDQHGPVVFVGALPHAAASIPLSDELTALLFEEFCCVPVLLGIDIDKDFGGFCDKYLWPILHEFLPPTPSSSSGRRGGGVNFDGDLYHAYLSAIEEYADRVWGLLSPDEDLVFVHDYHLWALPSILRHKGPLVCGMANTPRESTIVLSKFIRCLKSLSGAVRVNPWNVDDVAKGMNSALLLNERDRQMWQKKHFSYLITHDIADWRRSLDKDLQRASKMNVMNILSTGFALNFRVDVLGPNFQNLLPGDIHRCYYQRQNRLIILDYDGTVMPEGMIIKYPSKKLICVLKDLCSDPKNTVFLVSGRRKDKLAGWFGPCERLGISADHGYFIRWSRDSPWESPDLVTGFEWKKIAEPVMKHFTETTDGSYVEAKEAAVIWHYEDVHPDFASFQTKKLQDHLLNVLANEPVSVKSGHNIVVVNHQDLRKGTIVRDIITTLGAQRRLPDFIFASATKGLKT